MRENFDFTVLPAESLAPVFINSMEITPSRFLNIG